MALQEFEAQVRAVSSLTAHVREIQFTLRHPPEIVFKPGQFISFHVPSAKTGRMVVRPYSIASSPAEPDRISIVLNYVAGGPGSSYLFSLKEGDAVQFRGPAGSFYLRDDPTRNLLLVATGTGIAPMRSMVLDAVHRQDSRAVGLYWGLRSEHDLYYHDELARWSAHHYNIKTIVTLSRPGPSWSGHRGRVTRLIEDDIESVEHLAAYICGNSGMIHEVSDVLSRKGLCPIYREKYYDDTGSEGDDR